VIELSLNEVEQLAAKVGRGAGYSWGLAEDIARAARVLAASGLPWADALMGLAAFRQGATMSMDCPMLTAARLSDDPPTWDAAPLVIRDVAAPLWLAAGLAAPSLTGALAIDWDRASLRAADGALIADPEGGEWLAPSGDVRIEPTAWPSERPRPLRRALADEATLAALAAIAERVYVPASESSRARGAGGGRVDDD
jgi:hypothetical protein